MGRVIWCLLLMGTCLIGPLGCSNDKGSDPNATKLSRPSRIPRMGASQPQQPAADPSNPFPP
jgi:hypothetical protein